MPIYNGQTKSKLFLGNQKVKKAYLGDVKVYSSGNIVTYMVDSGVTYREEVDEGASCLSPKTFTPTKNGWTFAGWREDKTANGSVLTNKVMGDAPVTLYAVFKQDVTKTFTPTKNGWTFAGWREDKTANGSVLTNKVMGDAPVTLYAVFKQDVTLTLYNGSASPTPHYFSRYYNNAQILNPTYKIPQVGKSGWTARGWSTSNAANGAIAYAHNATITIDKNITLWGCYHKNVTMRYDGGGATGGSTATQSGTVYYNSSGQQLGATFSLSGCGYSRNGYYFQGWSYDSQVVQPGNAITITDSTYVTATWTAISFYAIQNGKLVQCPNASAWHGGYNCGSGEISDGGTNFYGGAGHTGGDVDQSWGADTGNQCPNASAWHGGYNCGSGEISDGGTNFYGGAGHTGGDVDQSWGADTGNIDTKGCANVQIDGYVNIWGSNTFGASLQVWGNGQLILDTWESNAIKNINISAYSTVRVRINAGISWMDDKDAWVNVGFKNIRFYT